MVDYIADYLENIRERRVFPDVKPGYLRELLPDVAPTKGEDFDTIFQDVERCIMPGRVFIFRIWRKMATNGLCLPNFQFVL